jgi:uncharacterized repeat protein (TIGR02543 family)
MATLKYLTYFENGIPLDFGATYNYLGILDGNTCALRYQLDISDTESATGLSFQKGSSSTETGVYWAPDWINDTEEAFQQRLNNDLKFYCAITEDESVIPSSTAHQLIFETSSYLDFSTHYTAKCESINHYLYPGHTYYLWLYPVTNSFGAFDWSDGYNSEDPWSLPLAPVITLTGSIPSYTVSYVIDGAIAGPSEQTKHHDLDIELSFIKPNRPGYTFIGWSTSNNGSVAMQPGDIYTENADLVLYAVWQANSYTLTIDPNGGVLPNGSTAALTLSPSLIFDNSNWRNLGAQTPTRTGYTFTGWFIEKDWDDDIQVYDQNGSCINDGVYWKDNRYVYTDNLTVCAQWQINKYSDTFDANGGIGGAIRTGDYGSSYYAPTVSRKGYTFVGWYTDKTGGTEVAGQGQRMTHDASNDTFYARWAPNPYTLTIDPNGGTIHGDVTNAFSFEIPLVTDSGNWYYIGDYNPVRVGYTLTGWFTQKEGGRKVYDQTGTCVNDGVYWKDTKYIYDGNLTVYAQWKINQYTDTFICNKQSFNEAITGDYGSTYTAPTPPTLTGFKFTGWWTQESGGTKVYGAGELITHDEKNDTFYAQWIVNSFTVSYDANGGSGAPASQTKTGGEPLLLSSEEPTRDGYIFQGWATTPNGMVLYQPGASYVTDASVTLYAIWKGANLVSKNARACIQFGGSVNTCRVVVRHSGSDTKCKPVINHNDVK